MFLYTITIMTWPTKQSWVPCSDLTRVVLSWYSILYGFTDRSPFIARFTIACLHLESSNPIQHELSTTWTKNCWKAYCWVKNELLCFASEDLIWTENENETIWSVSFYFDSFVIVNQLQSQTQHDQRIQKIWKGKLSQAQTDMVWSSRENRLKPSLLWINETMANPLTHAIFQAIYIFSFNDYFYIESFSLSWYCQW